MISYLIQEMVLKVVSVTKVMTRDQSVVNSMQLKRPTARQARKSRKVPVPIKQLLKSAESNFQMFRMTFSMVRVRAIVRNIGISSTKIAYLLEGNTGQITAHYWLEEGDTLKAPDVMLNKYATLYGSGRSQRGQKNIMVKRYYTSLYKEMLNRNDPLLSLT
uniref:Uncharacterized protein n=1 Tax=Glossina morsitans morsitans TaxID=37546 RepID=A0A1B0FKM3_GLOMM